MTVYYSETPINRAFLNTLEETKNRPNFGIRVVPKC